MTRMIAAGTSLVLLLLFVYTGYVVVTTDDLVVPTNGVIGTASVDDPAEGRAGQQALAERTQLQRWRPVSGPSPEQPDREAPAQGAGTPPERSGVADVDGRSLVQSWLANKPEGDGMLNEPRYVEGVSSLPGPVVDVFEQPAGRDWRSLRNNWVIGGGALYLLGVAALLALFLSFRGRIDVKEGFTGDTVPRFNALERANHWLTATSFVLLALTGVVIIFGKAIIRPWLGASLFDDLAEASTWLHISLIVPFTLGILVMVAVWTWQNLPSRVDWTWLKRGGGFMSEESPSPPAERFNAGQKLIFWAVVLGGLVLIASGLGMMFPFLWTGYDGMLAAQSIHAIAAVVMIGIIFGHIYIGTIGMVGAFDAMWSGRVDRNWAKEHHSIWYRQLSDGTEGSERAGADAAAQRR